MIAKVLGEDMPESARGRIGRPDMRAQIRAWRLRAEELRTTAEQFQVPSAQESLRRAAANYDVLAGTLEGQIRTDAPKAGSG